MRHPSKKSERSNADKLGRQQQPGVGEGCRQLHSSDQGFGRREEDTAGAEGNFNEGFHGVAKKKKKELDPTRDE